MSWVIGIAVIAVALFFSGFFSGSETGIYCVNRVRLRVRSQQKQQDAVILDSLLGDELGILTTTLIGTNLMNYIATVGLAVMLVHLAQMSDKQAEIYTTLILTPLVFVFGEVLPKNLFRREAERWMGPTARGLAVANRIFRGMGAVGVLKAISRHTMTKLNLVKHEDRLDNPFHPRQEVAALLREGVAVGILSDEQIRIADRVLNLSQVPVGTAMVQKSSVVSIRLADTRQAVLRTIRSCSHSRLAVVGDDPRKIVGVLNVIRFLADGQGQSTEESMRPILVLEPSLAVSAALLRMRRARRAFAVVEDHWGNALGIVTLKDLVEEIVGELSAW